MTRDILRIRSIENKKYQQVMHGQNVIYMVAVLRNVNIAILTYSSPTLIYSTQTHTLCLCSMHSRARLSHQCLFAHARNLVLPCQLLPLVHSCKVSKSSISENPPIPLTITLLSFDNLTLPNYSTEYHSSTHNSTLIR